MADSNTPNPQQPTVVVAQIPQAPGPTEGLLQPVEVAKDPNARPTYLVSGMEVDPDGNPVGKGSKDKGK